MVTRGVAARGPPDVHAVIGPERGQRALQIAANARCPGALGVPVSVRQAAFMASARDFGRMSVQCSLM